MRSAAKRNPERAAEMVEAGIITRADACDGKVAHRTQNDARHAAKRVSHRSNRRATTYKCPFCRLYHVTKLRHGEDGE